MQNQLVVQDFLKSTVGGGHVVASPRTSSSPFENGFFCSKREQSFPFATIFQVLGSVDNFLSFKMEPLAEVDIFCLSKWNLWQKSIYF